MKEIGSDQIALAYVGSVLPESDVLDQVAFSRAGNMFQENLLAALGGAGIPASLILSQMPIRSFRNSSAIGFLGRSVPLASGMSVRLVPFVNLPYLRPITVGLVVVANLLSWGWQQRDEPNRIVFTYNLTEPSGLFTLVGARLIGAKAIAAVIDVNVPGETVPATWARRLDFWLQRQLIPRFDGIVVVNQQISQDFAPHVPYIRIEGGLQDEVLNRLLAPRACEERTDDTFTIVSVGSLDDFNGFTELLEAFSLIPGKRFRLRIAGDGPLKGSVCQAAARDPRIEYCGYLPFDQVLGLYETADVLINMRLTQRIKTEYFFPSKMMEYLGCGVPVITTCTGHVEEEYGDFVFLLKDEGPRGLAHMIEYVASLDPTIRAEKGKAAQQHIRSHSTWEAQGQRIAEFIRERVVQLAVKDR